MLGPDGLKGPMSMGRFDVTDNSDDHDGRSLDDGDGFDDFLLVRLGPRTIHDTTDMRHTSLETRNVKIRNGKTSWNIKLRVIEIHLVQRAGFKSNVVSNFYNLKTVVLSSLEITRKVD